MSENINRLYRSRNNRMVSGICGGLGEFIGADPTLIRLAAVLLAFTFPGTFLAYLLMIFIIPEEPVQDSPNLKPETQD